MQPLKAVSEMVVTLSAMVTEVTFVLPRNEKDLPVPLLMLIVSISLLSNKIEISEETSADVTPFVSEKM